MLIKSPATRQRRGSAIFALRDVTTLVLIPAPVLLFLTQPAVVDVDRSQSHTHYVIVIAAQITWIALLLSWSRSTINPVRLFGPAALPLAYIATVLLGPLTYISFTGKQVGSHPTSMLSETVVETAVYFLCAYAAGVLLGTMAPGLGRQIDVTAERGDSRRLKRLLLAGRVLLTSVIPMMAYQAVSLGTVTNSQYGENQLEYSAAHSIAILAELIIVPATAAILHANLLRGGRRPLASLDAAILGLVLAAQLFLFGNRGAVIAPALLFLLYTGRTKRPVNTIGILATLAIGASLFVFVGDYRGGEQLASGGPVNAILFNLSSPTYITYRISEVVPDPVPFFGGRTYLAALLLVLVPGILRAPMGLEVTDTGASAFRDLIGYTDANQGFGFSLPSEAYLNFGPIGVVVVGVIVGWLLQRLYSVYQGPLDYSLRSFAYPTILALLPYSFRSDLFGAAKSILFAFIVLFVLRLLSDVGSNYSEKTIARDGRHHLLEARSRS